MPSRRRLDVALNQPASMSTTARLLDRVEPTDRAEVDEPERAVGEDEHVSRMRVRVEEADAQYLVEHAAQQLVGEGVLVDLRGGELGRVGHGEALEALLDDEAACTQLRIDLRDPHLAMLPEHEGHLGHGVDLAPKVELGAQALRELLQELPGSKTLPQRCPPLRDVGQESESRKVAPDRVLHAGSLHLDDDCVT